MKHVFRQSLISLLVGFSLVAPGLFGQTSEARLEFADKVRMAEFGDGSPRPYFRMQLNIVDAKGTPVSFPLPADLKSAIQIHEDGQVYTPFYVRPGEGTSTQPASHSASQRRYSMLLIEIGRAHV